MDIKKILIKKIKLAAYNPRIDLQPEDPEYLKIKNNIDTFDLVEPLNWNKRTNNLVGGHQRLKILIARRDIEVDVSVVDLDINKEKDLNIALNKISGDWDFPKLEIIIRDLKELDFDINSIGFDDIELEELFEFEDKIDPDIIPEIEKKIFTKPGDLYLLGNHRLLCGDCTTTKNIELLMDCKKADMVFVDPPYGINLDTDFKKMKGKGYFNKIIRKKEYKKIIGDDQEFNPKFILNQFCCKEIFLWGADYYCHHLPLSGTWFCWDKRLDERFDKMFSIN